MGRYDCPRRADNGLGDLFFVILLDITRETSLK